MKLPPSRIPAPIDAPAIRWGILAPGSIANVFAQAVAIGTTSKVVAVGSRSFGRARAFADRHSIDTAYGSYEDLVSDDKIDAIYVASPHSKHRAHAELAIRSGKPVLLEKAFTRNATEARELVDLARESRVLLAEAMWSRYLPHYDIVLRAVQEGLLGDVRAVFADHGQRLWPDGPDRLSRPELAGGSLLDLGVYPVSFADHILGEVSSIAATGTLTDQGVDASANAILATECGAHAILSSTMAATTPTTAVVAGTEARIELDGRFYLPTSVRLIGADGTVHDESQNTVPNIAHGFSYEAAEVARALFESRLETRSMPHEATLRVMETLDEIRRHIGVHYPGEDLAS